LGFLHGQGKGDGREVRYDSKRYVELLAGACSSVLEPFDEECEQENLLRRALLRGEGTL